MNFGNLVSAKFHVHCEKGEGERRGRKEREKGEGEMRGRKETGERRQEREDGRKEKGDRRGGRA